MAPVLGYWNIRGLGESSRYLLHYLNVKFEDKRYPLDEQHDLKDNEWTRNDKHNLGLELPNLPYYIDGDIKITQSLAILRYLAREHKLYHPNSDNRQELVRFDVMEGHATDLGLTLGFMAYNPQFPVLKEHFAFRFTDMIKVTADFLGSNTWLFGEEISHIDFLLFEALDKLRLCYKDCLEPHENLRNFMERFVSLPGIKEYRLSSPKWPLFFPSAAWGGKGEAPE